MSISAKEEYLSKNPDIEQVPCSVTVGDPVRLGITKPDAAFGKYVLGKIKAGHPKGTIGEGRFAIPKEF